MIVMNEKDILLMCKDIAVYDIGNDIVLNVDLLPGCMKQKTLDYFNWMKSRYSAGSNVAARRLMLRAFGSDNHATSLDITRALSLTNCYWLKQRGEKIKFEEVTPYLHKEWDGNGMFTGGSISTLFVNGAASKCWLDSNTLLKIGSYKELEPFKLGEALGLQQNMAEAKMSDKGIILTNFTSTEVFFESVEQSGVTGAKDKPIITAINLFSEQMVALVVLDYLVENDDRHWGNFGFLRDANTGEYLGMAPYFDFDWAWCDNVVLFPKEILTKYKDYIKSICLKAKVVAHEFEHNTIITKRANELLELCSNQTSSTSENDKIIEKYFNISQLQKDGDPTLISSSFPTDKSNFIMAYLMRLAQWNYSWEKVLEKTKLTEARYNELYAQFLKDGK